MREIPHKKNVEGAVLGAALSSQEDCLQVVENLTREDFYHSLHEKIFDMIVKVFKQGLVVNLITINENKNNDIPMSYLTELMNSLPVNYEIMDFIKILKQSTYERKIFKLSLSFQDEDLDIEEFTHKLIEIPSVDQGPDESTLQDLFQNALEASYRGVSNPFGISSLDKYLGGVDYGELITIGGYTSQGKTMMGIQMAINFAEQGKRVLYCTSEMTPIETARRILSNQTHINVMDFRKGNLSKDDIEKIKQASKALGGSWDIIVKTVLYTSDVQHYTRKFNPDIIFVDHLQNMSKIGNYSDYQRVTQNMADLQSLALNTKTPVFVLSQLRRRKEDGVSAPQLSDLRDSGAIEEKSNMVLFMYWKKRLQGDVEPRYRGEEPEELAVIISKNRDGVVGKVILDFYPEYCKIEARPAPRPIYREMPKRKDLF
jgi:replicative DNA helicase